MPGRKDYIREEDDHDQAALQKRPAPYKKLAGEIAGGTADENLPSTRKDFKAPFLNNRTVVLERERAPATFEAILPTARRQSLDCVREPLNGYEINSVQSSKEVCHWAWRKKA